jgi:hypothetical protein
MTFVIRDLLRTSRYDPFLRIARRRAGLRYSEQHAPFIWQKRRRFGDVRRLTSWSGSLKRMSLTNIYHAYTDASVAFVAIVHEAALCLQCWAGVIIAK